MKTSEKLNWTNRNFNNKYIQSEKHLKDKETEWKSFIRRRERHNFHINTQEDQKSITATLKESEVIQRQ